MTKEELKKAFIAECTEAGSKGDLVVKGSPDDIIDWIACKFCGPSGPPFAAAFTGMHDKNGKPIHEGDHVKIYYKGEFLVCQVVYDPKHAAFFIKWQDGYVNHYFMNGSSYELLAGSASKM